MKQVLPWRLTAPSRLHKPLRWQHKKNLTAMPAACWGFQRITWVMSRSSHDLSGPRGWHCSSAFHSKHASHQYESQWLLLFLWQMPLGI